MLFASCWYLQKNLPQSISYTDSLGVIETGIYKVTAERVDSVSNAGKTQNAQNITEYNAMYKIFGIIPVGKTQVVKVPERYVQVLGTPFGIKIYADGVMVVGMSEVDTENGNLCPAKECGIKVGDVIHKVNGKQVYSNKELAKLAENCQGENLCIELSRNEKTMTVTVTPRYSVTEKCYKIGIWVRDSSAGIGTLTFYDSASGILAGLGHGITDSSTKKIIPIAKGELVSAEIISSEKSVPGDPGELHGRFSLKNLGNLLLNSDSGVYGTAKSVFATDRSYPVATKQEIKVGEAMVLTTVDGSEPKWYKCRIDKVYFSAREESMDMAVSISDPELLEKTGGIVQGMSGSPIIQNGKLIGAVAHVFVNEPTKGYAIFAEDMLEVSINCSKTQLKDAS
ncbi:MAG: SpoIVB peptidase [Clostridia bacterium]|nr:SpoIVB peptidase [Clostridia bacterium]